MIDSDKLIIHIGGTVDVKFKDWDAVVRYMGGLYRTDTARKHVDSETATNLVIERAPTEDGFRLTPFGGSVMRNHLYDLALEQLEDLTAKDYQKIVHNVTYVTATYLDDDFDILPGIDPDDALDTIQSVIQIKEDVDDYFFWVVHLDRSKYHIHGLKMDR